MSSNNNKDKKTQSLQAVSPCKTASKYATRAQTAYRASRCLIEMSSKLNVYEKVYSFYRKVLLEQISIANKEFHSIKKREKRIKEHNP